MSISSRHIDNLFNRLTGDSQMTLATWMGFVRAEQLCSHKEKASSAAIKAHEDALRIAQQSFER
eukprot:6553655-Prymnesium_polylepis.1